MTFLYGFLGGLAVVGLLTVGGVFGWKAHKAFTRYTAPKVAPPGEQELQRLKESQKAFRQLSNYSAEIAYGMTDSTTGGDK